MENVKHLDFCKILSPDSGPEEDHHALHDQVRAGAGAWDPGSADSDVMMIIMAMVTTV